MLKIGIVGKENYKIYYDSITENEKYQFIGSFDPSYQFGLPHYINPNLSFLSYEELLNCSDVLVFSSGEHIFLPMIEAAIKKSKQIFLHSMHNFNVKELIMLQKLSCEAETIIQIQHPFVFHEAFRNLPELDIYPMLIESKLARQYEVNLLPNLRNHILAVLCLTKSSIKKITANLISTFGEIPDIAKVRIDFLNSCIADLHINSIENKRKHTINIYSLNSNIGVDFENNTMLVQSKKKYDKFEYQKEENTNVLLVKKQLANFYINVLNNSTPLINIDKQLNTQKVVDKVMEKLRLCINL